MENAAPTTRCARCKRTLRTPAAVTAGIGPTCAKRIREDQAVTAAGFKPVQVAKANELIADRGITRARRGHPVFRAVSSDGTRTYLTTTRACTCPAGCKGNACYHQAAVLKLVA